MKIAKKFHHKILRTSYLSVWVELPPVEKTLARVLARDRKKDSGSMSQLPPGVVPKRVPPGVVP